MKTVGRESEERKIHDAWRPAKRVRRLPRFLARNCATEPFCVQHICILACCAALLVFFTDPQMSDSAVALTERALMHNVDGTSCFLHSLLVGLFLPQCNGFFDDNVLQADVTVEARAGDRNVRVATDEAEWRTRLQRSLRHFAGVVRGTEPLRNEELRVLRGALGALGDVDFGTSVHDPSELFMHLMRASGVNALFQVDVKTTKTYAAAAEGGGGEREEVETTVDEHLVETLFQKFMTTPDGEPVVLLNHFPARDEETPPENEYGLVKKTAERDFKRGRVLCFTRENASDGRRQVHYGLPDKNGSRAVLLPLGDKLFRLESVLCWRGASGPGGVTSGHYVAYAYDAASDAWVFYDNAARDASGHVKFAIVPRDRTIESFPVAGVSPSDFFRRHDADGAPEYYVRTRGGGMHRFPSENAWNHARHHAAQSSHNPWQPSRFGTMFLYARVA